MKKLVTTVAALLLTIASFATGNKLLVNQFNTYNYHGETDWDLQEQQDEYEQKTADEAAARAKSFEAIKRGVDYDVRGSEGAWMNYEDAKMAGVDLWKPAAELASESENGQAISPIELAKQRGAKGIVKHYGRIRPLDEVDTSALTSKAVLGTAPKLKILQTTKPQAISTVSTRKAARSNSKEDTSDFTTPRAAAEEQEISEQLESDELVLTRDEVLEELAGLICNNEEVDEIRSLISQYRVNVNQAEEAFGFEIEEVKMKTATPLVYAAFCNSNQAIRVLLSVGANPNYNANGQTDLPIFTAIKFLHEEALVALLDGKVNLNARDKMGRTPLLFTITTPTFLINEDANSSDTDLEQEERVYRIVEGLLKSGAKANMSLSKNMVLSRADHILQSAVSNMPNEERFVSVYEANPLMYAVAKGDAVLANILIKSGANVNVALPRDKAYPNSYRMTPLMLAAEMEDESMVELLLNAGADIHKTDKAGRGALTYALRMDEANMVLKGNPHQMYAQLQAIAKRVNPAVVGLLWEAGARLQGEVPVQKIRNAYWQVEQFDKGEHKMTELIDQCNPSYALQRALRADFTEQSNQE